MSKKQMLIIGPGKVGTTFALLGEFLGFTKIFVAGREQNSFDFARQYLASDAFRFCLMDELNSNEISDVNIICIATQDCKIYDAGQMFIDILDRELDFSGKVIFHTSGHKSSDLLADFKDIGFSVASMHPIKSVSSPKEAFETFAGTFCTVEGDKEAQEVLVDFIKECKGVPFAIDTEHKPLYHAAAVTACNYSTTLYDAATKLYEKAGIPEEASRAIIASLVKGTINNFEKLGSPDALTGPIERGDASTITDHLKSIEELAPEYVEMYKMLGIYTLVISKNKGLSDDAIVNIINAIDT